MPVLPEHSVGFIHIPKCAGTTLEVALGLARAYPRIGLEVTRTSPDFTSLFGGGLQHLTARELRENFTDPWSSLRYTFAVVRDPVERFVSHFVWKHFRFVEHGAAGDGPDANASSLGQDANVFEREVMRRFDEHLAHVERVAGRFEAFRDPLAGAAYCQGLDAAPRLDSVDRHLLPQCAYLYTRGTAAVDEVFDVRHLALVQQRLRRLAVPMARFERRMASALDPALLDRLRESVREKVRRLYPADFALLDAVGTGAAAGRDLPQRRSPTLPRPAAEDAGPRRRSAIGGSGETVPRVIWMYWHQGWERAPAMMKRCRQSWEVHNPSWELRCLDAASLGRCISLPRRYGQDRSGLPLASLSDVIRVHLLARHGGVWADATAFCARPLDDWIQRVSEPSGLFAYAKPGPGRPIASWFLASERGGAMVRRLRDCTDQLWAACAAQGPAVLEDLFGLRDEQSASDFLGRLATAGTGTDHGSGGCVADGLLSDQAVSRFYFWLHHLFGALLLGDEPFRSAWARVPEVSADESHFLQVFGVEKAPSDAVRLRIATRYGNVHKLNRKKPAPATLEGSVLGLLFDSIGPRPATG